MTERLSALLHDEAESLDVPHPAAHDVLTRGRGLRRRRHLVVVGAAVAVLAVIAGSALAAQMGDDRAEDSGFAGADADGAVFSIGSTVYLDGGATKATIDDTSIKSLHYTSAGLLVRHGDNPYSDGGGPQRFSLVRPDGSVLPIDVTLEETVHSTEPSQPYLAYAEVTDGTVEVVVRDLSDDTEVARVPVPGDFPWGGWAAPPVALSGDRVFVGSDDVARVVDWRTGEVSETDAIAPGYPEVFGGRASDSSRREASVVDVTTGETLLSVPVEDYGSLELSPDGRFAKLDTERSGKGFDVYDVAKGEHVSIDGGAFDYGWSADGDLFRLDGSALTVCAAGNGECTTADVDLDKEPSAEEGVLMKCTDDGRKCREVGGPPDFSGELKLGGMTYES